MSSYCGWGYLIKVATFYLMRFRVKIGYNLSRDIPRAH